MNAVVRLAVICLSLGAGQALGDDKAAIEGIWINGDGDGLIELTVDGDILSGKIVGSPDDPDNLRPSRLDAENPDPELRQRPLLGLVFLTGFRYHGEGVWKDGQVYDPNSGNTYKGTIRMEATDLLKLRGYIGISLFGRTETWVRRTQ